MRLRRLCLAIFAFRLFLSEPIQFLDSRAPIQPSDVPSCNWLLDLLVQIEISKQHGLTAVASGDLLASFLLIHVLDQSSVEMSRRSTGFPQDL
jgi:hypothetical protein